MLGIWQSHAAYQHRMLDIVVQKFRHNPKSINYYESAILKMYYLNLDNVKEDFLPLFSVTGRPSHHQPEIFRSFILMTHFKCASIDEWVVRAAGDDIICALVGVKPNDFPGASTHRDFFERLWAAGKPDKLKHLSLKPKTKHGNQKQPLKRPGIVKKLVDKALDGQTFKRIPERLYQTLFMKTAVIPSAEMGLLGDTSKIIASGDGTCVSSNASHRGKKACDCTYHCSCPRHFSDPNATWGWDSYHERYFFGYTAYLLSVHNSTLKLDLPIYLRFVEAKRHDSVSLVASLAHVRFLYKDFLSFDAIIADAAHDNYPTYDMLHQWRIKPFIDLSARADDKVQSVPLSTNGLPVCPDGYEMVNWGFERKRYRIKFRCPLAVGKINSCPFDKNCNNSLYGKNFYLRLADNLRLLTPIPRNSDEWKRIYNQRTAAERVNNRILTDYQLEHPKRYGKSKIAFFAFSNAINIHLDAQIKFGRLAFVDLVV